MNKHVYKALLHVYNRYRDAGYPYSTVEDWLQGLALDVEYIYYDISAMFKSNGVDTRESEDDYLGFVTTDYWVDMAEVLQDMWLDECISS